MRIKIIRACVIAAIALLCACAQQPHRAQPAPVVEESKPLPTPPAPTAAPPPKLKPKPKPTVPVPPKPETKDTDVTPAPSVGAPDGIERTQVGYYFDTLQGRLRQVAAPTILVTRSDGHIAVDISHHIAFGTDDAPLSAAHCAALAPIAKALIEYKMTRIVADVGAAGADEPALRSAKVRAAAIAKCLADAGVAARRLGTREVAMPSAQPITVLRIEPIVK
jgi:outer membrane protein OmpA-like peptidoglycan-associated protein